VNFSWITNYAKNASIEIKIAINVTKIACFELRYINMFKLSAIVIILFSAPVSAASSPKIPKGTRICESILKVPHAKGEGYAIVTEPMKYDHFDVARLFGEMKAAKQDSLYVRYLTDGKMSEEVGPLGLRSSNDLGNLPGYRKENAQKLFADLKTAPAFEHLRWTYVTTEDRIIKGPPIVSQSEEAEAKAFISLNDWIPDLVTKASLHRGEKIKLLNMAHSHPRWSPLSPQDVDLISIIHHAGLIDLLTPDAELKLDVVAATSPTEFYIYTHGLRRQPK
jgi:hypothetical protein